MAEIWKHSPTDSYISFQSCSELAESRDSSSVASYLTNSNSLASEKPMEPSEDVEPQHHSCTNFCNNPCTKGICKKNLARKIAAEIISTFILVFAGCGAVMANETSGGQVTHLGVSLAFGIVVTVLIYAIGHISGAHMNPAVSLAFATVQLFDWCLVPFYIMAQVGGAVCASSILRLVFGNHAYLGATTPSNSPAQSLVLEFIITFILMFVIMGVMNARTSITHLGGLAIGATVTLNAIFAGPTSGASMNPARSFGPAVVANYYSNLWIYFLGPILGALCGAWAYKLIKLP